MCKCNGFGMRLKSLRVFNGLTQFQLASFLGCSRVRVSRLESGQVSPSVDEVYMIMGLFEVGADELFRYGDFEAGSGIG